MSLQLWSTALSFSPNAEGPVMVMAYGCHSTRAPMRPMTSAKRTSPWSESEPQPSTVTVPPVMVAPARK